MKLSNAYHNECVMPYLIGNSESAFYYIDNSNSTIENKEREFRKNSFISLITNRQHYLENLKKIGDNWISGNSKQPTEESIEVSKNILNDLRNWYMMRGYNEFVYPKVIMSPTPSGGISIQIEMYPSKTAYFNIMNNDLEFEAEIDGYYSERDIKPENINESLNALYAGYGNKYTPTYP